MHPDKNIGLKTDVLFQKVQEAFVCIQIIVIARINTIPQLNSCILHQLNYDTDSECKGYIKKSRQTK